MAHFTKQEIEEIRVRLSETSVKDSDFDIIEEASGEIYIVILANGANKRISLDDLTDGIVERSIDDILEEVQKLIDESAGNLKVQFGAEIDLSEKRLRSKFNEEIEDTSQDLQQIFNTQIEQTAREITLEADEKIRNSAELLEEDYNSKISITAREIRSDVNEEIRQTEENITEAYHSEISQTAEAIRTDVSKEIEDTSGAVLSQSRSYTEQTADRITQGVETAIQNSETQTKTELRSELNQTATEITASVDETRHELDGTREELEGKLTVQAGLIASKVSQTDYDADNVVREQRYSQIEQTAEQIQSTVAHNKNEADGSFQNVQSLITQQSDLISTKVSQVEYDANNLQFSERFSSIEQTADHITSTVEEYRIQANESISALQTQILQQSDQILLKAEKAELDSVQSVLSNSIGELSVRADVISASVTGIQQELDSHDETLGAYYQWLTSLQTQVDGEIDTWFKPYSPLRNVAPEGQEPQWELDPTVSPYSDWLVEEQERGAEVVRDAHVRDVFYNTATGYGYIFTGTGEKGHRVYGWSLITDSAVVEALAAAARAQTTADGKMRTFLQQPVPPYQPGDMWIKPHTVTIDGSEVTYNEVWNCIIGKTEGQAFSISDWAKSDNYDAEITKANLKVLADAIVGQVTTYDSNGLITNKSTIEQKAEQIRLSVANTAIGTSLADGGTINGALLDTGVDITQCKIVVTANNFMVQDQQGRVALMTSGNKIKAAYLEIDGIFSTTPGSVWMTNVDSLNSTAQGYANTAEGKAKDYADDKADDAYNNAVDYVTNTAIPKVKSAYEKAIEDLGIPALTERVSDAEDVIGEVEGDVSDLSDSLDAAILRIQATEGGLSDIGYLAEALINGQTVSVGGLVLSSLIQLGSTTGPDSSWQVWSGINGVYNSSVAGNGIAAWYGGAMLDRYYSENTDANRAAKTLFRMDGSGYLASNNLWWGANGELHINNNTIIDNTGNLTLSQLASVVTELASYFTVVDYVKDGTTRHYLKLNASGAGGLDGFASDGFIVAGGAGSSSGGGGGGGIDLDRVWESLTNNTDKPNVKINTAHIPDMASTYGYLKGNQTITLTGVVTGSGTTSIATSIADGALSIAKTNGLQAALNAKQDTISDLSTIRTRSNEGHSVYGYFSNGVLGLEHVPLDDRLSYVDPEAGEEITIDDPGTAGTVLWGAESANNVALDVNGVSKTLVKQAAMDGVYSSISTLSARIGTKQDYIGDLSSIRSNASLGATAHSWGDHRQAGYLTSVPTASAQTLGLIRIGTGLSIDGSGVVSVTGQTQGTVTRVDVGSTQYSPSAAGVVSLPAYPTALPNAYALTVGNKSYNGSEAVSIDKSDVGLGNVTNDAQVKRTEMGAASGVATLGSDGKIPSSQLPSYVDDVLEYASLSVFPTTGESGKIYVALDTNKTYRWSGSAYVEISPSVVIGTTTGTAFDGGSGYSHVTNGDIHVTATQKTAWTAKYNKPVGGIPKEHLDSSVRTSLGKADSALQSSDIIALTNAEIDTIWNNVS